MGLNDFGGILSNFAFDQLKRDAAESLTKAVKETVKDVEKDAKNNVPVKTGEMKDSIYSGFKIDKHGNPIAWVKSSDKGAFAVEYGHGPYAPHPFMRPAIEKNKDKIGEKFKI